MLRTMRVSPFPSDGFIHLHCQVTTQKLHFFYIKLNCRTQLKWKKIRNLKHPLIKELWIIVGYCRERKRRESTIVVVVDRGRCVWCEYVLIVIIINQFFILMAFSRPSHFPFLEQIFSRKSKVREKKKKSVSLVMCAFGYFYLFYDFYKSYYSFLYVKPPISG